MCCNHILLRCGVFAPWVVLYQHVKRMSFKSECEPINGQAAVRFMTSENVILPITGKNLCLFVMAALCSFMGIRSVMSI